MINSSRLLTVTGILLIVFAVVLKLGGTGLLVGAREIQLISVLVVANSCFLLALVCKK